MSHLLLFLGFFSEGWEDWFSGVCAPTLSSYWLRGQQSTSDQTPYYDFDKYFPYKLISISHPPSIPFSRMPSIRRQQSTSDQKDAKSNTRPQTLDRPTPYIGVLGKIGRCVESAIPRNPSIEKVGVSAQHTVVGTDGSVLLWGKTVIRAIFGG